MLEPALAHQPLSNLFPLIECAAIQELVADVRQDGVRETVVLREGKISMAAIVIAPRVRLAVSVRELTMIATANHAQSFVGESVEMDALPPRVLRVMVVSVIQHHVSPAVTKAL
jgi:hypothetical protein